MKPALVKIVLAEEQIYANRPITARCETWGSSPAARVVWRLGRQVIGDSNVSTTQRSNSTVSKLPLILNKDDNGRRLTCRAENPRFPGGVLEQTEIVDVACESIFGTRNILSLTFLTSIFFNLSIQTARSCRSI